MSSVELGQIVVNALLLSGILALVALGFSLVWGIMNIVNLAHGPFIMLGAYVTFWSYELWGVDPFLSIPISMLALFVVGFAIQRVLINQIIRAPLLVTFLLTFGLEILIVNLVNYFFKADMRSVTTRATDRRQSWDNLRPDLRDRRGTGRCGWLAAEHGRLIRPNPRQQLHTARIRDLRPGRPGQRAKCSDRRGDLRVRRGLRRLAHPAALAGSDVRAAGAAAGAAAARDRGPGVLCIGVRG